MEGDGRGAGRVIAPWPRLDSGSHHTTLLQGRRCQYNCTREDSQDVTYLLIGADLFFYNSKLNLDAISLHTCRHSNPLPGQTVRARPHGWEPHRARKSILPLIILFRPGTRQPQTLTRRAPRKPSTLEPLRGPGTSHGHVGVVRCTEYMHSTLHSCGPAPEPFLIVPTKPGTV